jgi:hypothetical protein
MLILNGEVKIIKKNNKQESLDKDNNIIQDSVWKKSWENDRVLINSNNKYKKMKKK